MLQWEHDVKVSAGCTYIYLKEGNNTYGTVNPQNCHPVFTEKQLIMSLQAMSAYVLALCMSVIMDTEQLHTDI